MKLQRITIALTALLCTSMLGCMGTQYNGSWSWGASEREDAERAASLAQLQRERAAYWEKQAAIERQRRELIAQGYDPRFLDEAAPQDPNAPAYPVSQQANAAQPDPNAHPPRTPKPYRGQVRGPRVQTEFGPNGYTAHAIPDAALPRHAQSAQQDNQPRYPVNYTNQSTVPGRRNQPVTQTPAAVTPILRNPGATQDLVDRIAAGDANPPQANMPQNPGPAPQLRRPPSASGLSTFGRIDAQPPTGVSPLDDAGNSSQITFAHEGADYDPAIHPSGKLIAFASTRHRRQADIYIQTIGGSTVRQLTTHAADDQMPTFSPDGKTVAFCSNRSGNWDIYLVDVDGGKPRQLTTSQTHDIHPSISPDGRNIVYSSYGSRSGQWELWLIDVDNPAKRRHIGYGLLPRWSPVDNRILFQKARQRGDRWFSIWTIDLVDGEVRRPTEIVASSNAAAITPSWSPDGQAIVFATVIEPDSPLHRDSVYRSDIWVTDLDGRYRENLTQSSFANLQPIWAPDGRILFVSNRGAQGIQNIWSLSAGGDGVIVKRGVRPSDPMNSDPANGASAIVPPVDE